MSTARYPMPEEVRVSCEDAINMLCDDSIVVLTAIPNDQEEMVDVTYWPDVNGLLPPWITPRKAA